MRRIPVILAVTALAAAGLAGCASAPAEASCPRPTPGAAVSALVEVEGDLEEAPEVTVRTPFTVNELTARDLVVGDGPRITSDKQVVVLDVTVVGGETGEPLVGTAYNGDTSRALTLADLNETLPDFATVMQCATEGSRVVVGVPATGVAEGAQAGLGLNDQESAVAVVDVRRVYLASADGEEQYDESRGLPTVVRDTDGRPGIIVPDVDAPTEPVTRVLKKGEGAVVNDEESVLIQVVSAEWDDPRNSARSTWDRQPARITLDGLPATLADALRGQPAGSQVLVVQPAGGDESQGEPAEATVNVIDILGVG